MSSDPQLLAALAMRTGQEMRYFELMTMVNGDLQKKCFVCIGKHALFFVRKDLNALIHDGGELLYAYITKAVQDRNTRRHFVLVLNENKPEQWTSERLFMQSEHRDQFLQHLRCNWQTDHMWRLGRVHTLPCFEHDVTQATAQKVQDDPETGPFINFRWEVHDGYRIMIPYDFKERPNEMHQFDTGEFQNSAGVSIALQVHPVLTIDQMHSLGRSHIRWVAAEYKAQLIKTEPRFYVLRHAPYQKCMNLIGDIAAWHAWETVIKTPQASVVCMLLRRQYVPPVCNCTQDLAIVVRCPEPQIDEHVDEEQLKAKYRQANDRFNKMLLAARLMADSVSSNASSTSVYRDMVQAKLDALRFDEEGFEWVASHLKLRPKWYRDAKIFLRGIIQLFIDDGDNQGFSDWLSAEASHALANAWDNEEWAELEAPKELDEFVIDSLLRKGEGLPKESDDDGGLGADDVARATHTWEERVSRYLAWAVNGGILGPKFTLDTMIERIPSLTEVSQKKLSWALSFLLHLRPKNFVVPWAELSLTALLRGTDLTDWRVNDQVMHSILSTDYLRKCLGRNNEQEYMKCLAVILRCMGSVNLKAYVCRLFMEMKMTPSTPAGANDDVNLDIIEGVVWAMEVSRPGGTFLATYASAALVNMSSGNENVKKALMSHDIARLTVEHLHTKDDDLAVYTLMLLANMTKEPFYRSVAAAKGVLAIVYDMLTSTYNQCRHRKEFQNRSAGPGALLASPLRERILAQICIVIGQYCNDQLFHDQMTYQNEHTVNCILYIYTHGMHASHLSCKALFALKQLANNRGDLKKHIGDHVIPQLVRELGAPEKEAVPTPTSSKVTKEKQDFSAAMPWHGHTHVEKTPDFLNNAIMLLELLSTNVDNCVRMRDNFLQDLIKDQLMEHPSATKLDKYQARCARIRENIAELTKDEKLL